MASLGIVFSFIALVGWAVADFFIQRSTRDIGVWRTRLILSAVSTLLFFPLAIHDLHLLAANDTLVLLLSGLSLLSLISGYFGLRALKQGKLSVVEPITGLEVPCTVILGLLFFHETVSLTQAVLMVFIFIGIVLAVTRMDSHRGTAKQLMEKGAIYAFIAAVGLSIMNLLIGLTSRLSSPVFVIWFTGLITVVMSIGYVCLTKRWPGTISKLAKHARPLLLFSVIGGIAWVSFAYATTLLSISVVTSVTEAYIALAVLLGVLVNRERLRRHQIVGIILSISGAIVLAAVTV